MNGEPARVTKKLANGNLAIFQIVNPEDVSMFVKFLRTKKGNLARRIRAIEAAIRVGITVYKNCIKKGDTVKPRVIRKEK